MQFGQLGHIVNTAPLKKKFDVRDIQALYLRVLGPDLLLVWKTERKSLKTIRAKEFILSQHTPKPKANKKSLFEQAPCMPKFDNTTYENWYAN